MDLDDQPKWKVVLMVVLLIEWTALLIALVLPITPSKTGSGNVRLAEHFIDNASYLHEVLLNFVLVNLLVGLFAPAFLIYVRWHGPGD